MLVERIKSRGVEGGERYLVVEGDEAGDLHWWRLGVSPVGVNLEDQGNVGGAHENTIMSMALTKDGTLLATGGFDAQVKIWEMEPFAEKATLEAHTGWIYDVEFSPSGRTLASGSNDNSLRLWDLVEMEPKGVFREHENYVIDVAFSADGRDLASAGDEGYTVIRKGSGQ